ncbi:MAG: hypothetical protein AAGN35_09560 [Bacteroidota bacterium]
MRFTFVALLLFSGILPAQVGDWEAQVEPSPRPAYCDILLSPELVARLNPEFGNLRLYDGQAEEVPYLVFSEGHVEQEVALRWYPRVREDHWRRWYSRSYFKNPRADLIDRMVLKIRNADVRQTFWLSGSDDLQRWYIVKEDFAYASNYDPGSSYNLLTLDFPPVDYKYYKVEIRHHWHEPIQIMGAGYYAVSETAGHYQPVPRPALAQTENNDRSVVDLDFGAAHYIDRLFFEIDGPEMYHREARLERKQAYGGYELLEKFVLDSRSVHLLRFESLRARDLRLTVENADDKPLRVAAVQALQLQKYLTAKLAKGDSATLLIGPESQRAPVYDLAYFTSDLPTRRPRLRTLNLVDRRPRPDTASRPAAPPIVESAPTPKTKPFLQDKAFLWIGIVLIVGLLGYLSVRMLRDLKEDAPAADSEK